MVVITVATQETSGLTALRKSVERLGMDLVVLGLGETWKGFGMKVILTREYLRTLPKDEHFIFVDAYDVVFLRKPDIAPGILFSAEKNCWPDPDADYPSIPGLTWRYLNSGCYMAPVGEFLELTDQYPVDYADDDQRYFTNIYLKSDKITLDHWGQYFQSYAFAAPGDFTINGAEVINNVTKQRPPIIHFNGKCLDPKIYAMLNYATMAEVQAAWKDTIDSHKEINEAFINRTNLTPELNAHRTWVEQNIWGFGERSFPWLWYLVIQELPKDFTFMEIGVFRGQTLSLVELIAGMQGKKSKRYGVTPLSTDGGMWESDYEKDIATIHHQFKLKKDYTILKGLSEDPEIIEQAGKVKLDCLFIDGGHEERHITNDLVNYAHLVKPGGYMVVDDCCNGFPMPWGYFGGIQSVTNVVDKMLPPVTESKEWEFVFSCVHNRVYVRK